MKPAGAWYNGDIDRDKRKRRKLERRWRKSRLVIDRELYKEQCKVVSSLIKKAKENYYSNIQENKGNRKVLLNTVTRLLHRNTEKCYPTAPSSEVLANRSADFFCQKVPVQLKEAMIRPKLKKESLDREVYSNFRPISNLKFISKMIEKPISYQLTNYLRDNDLEESLQSAYKTFHSTETALVKVHNDIVSATDNPPYIILLLLDLPAAFDTVDHKILLQRLSCRFGINGKALRWLKSYLENREQVINVKGATSCRRDLQCGVPQGSMLGPILFVLYTSPLGDIVRSHGLSCHFYADDTQIYCSFKFHDQAASVQAIESCLNDIDAWMLANMLKLNRDKTELLVIGPKHKVNPPIKGIHVAGEYIEVSNNARN